MVEGSGVWSFDGDWRLDITSSLHRFVLVGFALLVGLVEGPAEIAAVAGIITTAWTGKLRAYRLGVAEIGILIWALAGLFGLVMDPGPHSSADTTRPLLALAFLIGSRGVGSDDVLLSRMAWAFVVACAINVAYGLLQYVIGELPLDPLLLKNADSGQIWVPNRVYHVRAASGLFYNRLKLAHVGMCGALVASVIAAAPAVQKRTRILATIASAFIAGGLLFTYARMAIVAIIAAWLGLALVLRRHVLLGSVAVVSGLGVVIALFTEDGRTRMSSFLEDIGLRKAMIVAAIRVWAEHPLLGVGHGAYRNAVSRLEGAGLTGVHLTSPHNLWFQILAETGVVGFAGFNVAAGFCLWAAVRRIRGSGTSLDRAALLSLLAILFVGLMHFSLHHAPVGLLFFTFAGVCVRRLEDGQAQEASG